SARTAPPEARPLSRDADGPGANPPADLAAVPDAEPRVEAIRPGGANKPYQALGRDYVPGTRDAPFSERGLASWYGAKFHGRPTASGEVYDMYAMTAAHPTLPIPSYARIRNPANGREVLVRINDRGPFHAGRIVDLSYAAAFKLDLLRGVAPVELERITFDEIRTGAWRGSGAGATRLAAASAEAGAAPAPVLVGTAPAVAQQIAAPTAAAQPVAPLLAQDIAFVAITAPAPAPIEAAAPPGRSAAASARGFWVQLGAFREPDGAETFRRRIGADDGAGWLAPMLAVFAEAALFRVQAGPYPNRDEAEGAAQRMRAALAIVPLVVERR
ncbi:MAG TPA: septal ring lytic transglycosylase RlpA family protein, partial [Caldimonas sp.]